MARSRIVHGASVSLYVNGVRFAQVTDFTFTISTPREEKRGIDSLEAFELALTEASVSGSLTVIRQSQDGGAEGAGMVAPFPELSREKYASFMLIEAHTNTVIFEARRCSVSSQTWSAATRSILTGRINFSAIEWANEVRPLQ